MNGRPYAEVIGDPISHSKSPAIHNFWLAKLGIDAEYRACRVRADDLAAYFERCRYEPAWRGCNVTVPHKLAALSASDNADHVAVEVGAANVLFRAGSHLRAANTDVAGFAAPLPDVAGARAIVIGAGGAGRACLVALRDRGVDRVSLVNRDKAKAAALLAELGVSGDVQMADEVEPEADLLVNASSLGMVGMPPAPDLTDRVGRGGCVYDLVYVPLETALLAAARARGLMTIDGLAMLVGQAGAAFEMFFGAPAPREHDVELRALLTT